MHFDNLACNLVIISRKMRHGSIILRPVTHYKSRFFLLYAKKLKIDVNLTISLKISTPAKY